VTRSYLRTSMLEHYPFLRRECHLSAARPATTWSSGRQTLQALGRPRLSAASCPMIRIAISTEAFEAIAWTLPLGNVGYENKIDEEGQRLVDRRNRQRLPALRYHS
jgi:hypothetical protein